MRADDDVRARVSEQQGRRLLVAARARLLLDAPVQEDDQRVGVRTRLLHRRDQRVGALGRCQAGLRRRRRPRRDEVRIDHLGRADDRDALPMDGRGEGRVRLCLVVAESDQKRWSRLGVT